MIRQFSKFTFQFMSDLHLEFRKHLPEIQRKTPYLFLAGDIGIPDHMLYKSFFHHISSQFDHVFYVPGNHEYYHHSRTMKDTKELIQEILHPYENIHLLDNGIYDLPGVRVIGSTLWTPVPDNAPLINDNFKIHYETGKKLAPNKTREMNLENVKFIQNSLLESPYPAIVMSHHLPSYKMVPPKYQNDPINCHFSNNLDSLFRTPLIGWICGHSHVAHTEWIQGIPCSLNPIGYPGEKSGYEGVLIK